MLLYIWFNRMLLLLQEIWHYRWKDHYSNYNNNTPQQCWAYVIRQDGVELAHSSRIPPVTAHQCYCEAFQGVFLSGCFPFPEVASSLSRNVDGYSDTLKSSLVRLTASRPIPYDIAHASILYRLQYIKKQQGRARMSSGATTVSTPVSRNGRTWSSRRQINTASLKASAKTDTDDGS